MSCVTSISCQRQVEGAYGGSVSGLSTNVQHQALIAVLRVLKCLEPGGGRINKLEALAIRTNSGPDCYIAVMPAIFHQC